MTQQSMIILPLLFLFLIMVGIIMLSVRMAQLESRLANQSMIEAKIDLLLKQAGLSYDPYKNSPAPVAEALRNGQKIMAIKRYRELTGVGLKDAKDYVDELQRRSGLG